MQRPKIYAISGLGGNERLFELTHIPGYEIVPLKWYPFDESDSLKDYALKLSIQIPNTDEIILLGVSMGGMIAQEIAKIRNTKMLILISTVKSSSEFPFYFKLGEKIKVGDMIPNRIIKPIIELLKPILGRTYSNQESEIYESMISEFDPNFVRWGVNSVPSWGPPGIDVPFVHIHGAKDTVFPLAFINDEVVEVEKGTHMMILSQHQLLSSLISKFIKEHE